VGWPSIFIRLGGCNLACGFCDTEFEDFSEIRVDELIKQVDTLSGYNPVETQKWTHDLVVITGGEPFRQPIGLLCDRLIEKGYGIQIETNGTIYQPVNEKVHIIVSPKATSGKFSPIREDLLERVTAFKCIISADHYPYQDVPDLGVIPSHIPVYVQPMDEYDVDKNKRNLERSVYLSQKFGYRLSLQTHKIAGVE
jgi:organic radical activating enzyme